MGRFLDKQKAAADDKLLNLVSDNNKLDSVKEILTLLSGVDDDATINSIIDARVAAGITAAIASEGAIETWADARYEPKTAAAESDE